MPSTISSDKSVGRVDAASRKASAKGSGTAGGSLKSVDFTPGKNTVYSTKRK